MMCISSAVGVYMYITSLMCMHVHRYVSALTGLSEHIVFWGRRVLVAQASHKCNKQLYRVPSQKTTSPCLQR